jgi:ABC-2 type transport system permease protein
MMPSKPSNLPRDTALLFWRGLRAGLRSPVTAFGFPIIFPLLAMVLVSQLFGQITKLPAFPDPSYIAYVAPGTLLLVPMMGAGYAATGLVIDAHTGFLDRIRLLSARSAAAVLAKLLFEAVRVLPAGAVVMGVSVAMGAHLDHGAVSVAGVLGLIVLWSMAYSGLFYLIGLRTLSAQAPIALLPLCLPVLFCSTALMPRTLLPAWMRTASDWNPFTYLVAGARTLMDHGPIDGGTVGKAVLIAAAVLVITQVLVLLSFRRVVRTT